MNNKNKIIMVCIICLNRNYQFLKTISNSRLELKKYCSNCNSHVLHKETR